MENLVLDYYLMDNDLVRGDGERDSKVNRMVQDGLIDKNDSANVIRVVLHMYQNTMRGNRIEFTLKNLIEGCGFTYKSGKNASQGVFKRVLFALNSYGYFGDNKLDFLSIKPNETICITSNNLLQRNDDGVYTNFVVLESYEIKTIKMVKGVDSNKLLSVFLSIKARIRRGTDAPEVCYPTKSQMAIDLCLSEKSIQLYIKKLEESGVIVVGNAGSFSKVVQGKVKHVQSANTYAIGRSPSSLSDINKSMHEHSKRMRNEYKWISNGSVQRVSQIEGYESGKERDLDLEQLFG